MTVSGPRSNESTSDTILDAYSQHASDYDLEPNQRSCWGRLATADIDSLSIRIDRECVVDVGCGTGDALVQLAARLPPSTKLIGIEPASGMRAIAARRTSHLPNVSIRDGRFEALPLGDGTVGHLISIHAFHWIRHLHVDSAIAELHRVLAPDGDLNLFFVARGTGQEFIGSTSGILRRHLGLARWLASAKLRTQLSLEQAEDLFGSGLPGRRVQVRELVETHFDTLEGHWAWWVRLEGHFADLEPAARSACYHEVRQALAGMQSEAGIPYTTRILHVSARAPRTV